MNINERLWNAAGGNDIAKIEGLLKEGADPNWKGTAGRTAMHQVCIYNCEDILDLLIHSGGKVNVIDDENKTPLHFAAQYCRKYIVQRLIQTGLNIEQQSDSGTPLNIASYHGNIEAAAALLNYGAKTEPEGSDWGGTPLHEAAKRGCIDVARLLLQRGANVNAVDRYGNDRTPLHDAIYPGEAAFIELLISFGADIEHRNNWGATPLHIAARLDAQDIVESLLKHGANRNIKDNNGLIPLDEAHRKRNSKIIELIENYYPHLEIEQEINNHSFATNSEKSEGKLNVYQEARLKLIENTRSEGFLNEEELKIRADIYDQVRKKLNFKFCPDNDQRILRNNKAIELLGNAKIEYKEIVSKIRVITLESFLELDGIHKQQELNGKVKWLDIKDNPLLIVFVSHRWEKTDQPDPYGSQLFALKALCNDFLNIAQGFKQSRINRLDKIPGLFFHGLLQATYLTGEIASFIDNFSKDDYSLRTELCQRIGIVYDYMSLPQNPRSKSEENEFLVGLQAFRRIMATIPNIILRYPDDQYNSRTWCELEYWTGKTSPVLRIDLLGKPIKIEQNSPPKNFNSQSNYFTVLKCMNKWENDDTVNAMDIAKPINENYHYAFSYSEKTNRVPVLTRPYFNNETQNRIWKGKELPDNISSEIIPSSFNFWCAIREKLCGEGLEDEDFAEVLINYMRFSKLNCTEERDKIVTALWLLGYHEIAFDYGMRVFYGRCLIRYLNETKDLKVSLFYRLPNQSVHFKFADGEESIEG
jgi:ankyrin repeat protein